MPRDIPIGNGRLLVNFDSTYHLRDIYYPYVGKANHGHGGLSRVGVWADGRFSWIHDAEWELDIRYRHESLVTEVRAANSTSGLEMVFRDCVDIDRDLLVRRVQVTDRLGRAREVRVFFHYEFRFWEVGHGDSIYYDPASCGLIAYKDRCYFALNGLTEANRCVDSWSVGREGPGGDGAWQDAEDGLLDRAPVAFGKVDGVVALHADIAAGSSTVMYQWLAAATGGAEEALRLHELVLERGPDFFLTRTENYWRAWVNKEEVDYLSLPDELVALDKRSLLILRTHIDARGGIIAAADDPQPLFGGQEGYAYVWPRDGALCAYALSRAGYGELARSFFSFCGEVITRSGYFLHKYIPNGAVASSWMGWVDSLERRQLPIEQDETALVLFALWQHYQIFLDIEFVTLLYRKLIKNAADFLVAFREPTTGLPAPSYDLWEEEPGIYTFTVATVWAGLQAAANFAEVFGELDLAHSYRRAAAEIKRAALKHLYDEDHGRFLKRIVVKDNGVMVRDSTIDSSAFGVWYFGMLPPSDARVVSTMQAIQERLWCSTEVGGIARYEGDLYHALPTSAPRVLGNPWVICTIWTAEYLIARAEHVDQMKPALDILLWVSRHARPSGVIAEQLDPISGEHLSAAPLAWSHSSYVAVVRSYLAKYRRLAGRAARGATRWRAVG